jgi:hypothetical protein
LTIVRLSGLDPRHAQGGFIDAIAGIGRVLRAAFNVGETMEVHLTGGFKATLLHTLAMTEVLYSQDPDRVSACYVFEDTSDTSAPVIPIGMRPFPSAYIASLRADLIKVRDHAPGLRAGILKGTGWNEAGTLNSFGYGYLAVLGEQLTRGRPGPT